MGLWLTDGTMRCLRRRNMPANSTMDGRTTMFALLTMCYDPKQPENHWFSLPPRRRQQRHRSIIPQNPRLPLQNSLYSPTNHNSCSSKRRLGYFFGPAPGSIPFSSQPTSTSHTSLPAASTRPSADRFCYK